MLVLLFQSHIYLSLFCWWCGPFSPIAHAHIYLPTFPDESTLTGLQVRVSRYCSNTVFYSRCQLPRPFLTSPRQAHLLSLLPHFAIRNTGKYRCESDLGLTKVGSSLLSAEPNLFQGPRFCHLLVNASLPFPIDLSLSKFSSRLTQRKDPVFSQVTTPTLSRFIAECIPEGWM